MKSLVLSVILLSLFSFSASAAQPLSEKQKVDKLLDIIEKSNLTFIRNGKEYNSKKARKHLEYKYNYVTKGFWFWTKPQKITAIKFIEKLASSSSTTGKLYFIKTKEGIEVPSGDWLKSRLKEIESKIITEQKETSTADKKNIK